MFCSDSLWSPYVFFRSKIHTILSPIKKRITARGSCGFPWYSKGEIGVEKVLVLSPTTHSNSFCQGHILCNAPIIRPINTAMVLSCSLSNNHFRTEAKILRPNSIPKAKTRS